MTDAPAPVYFCSFCGKSQHDVAKLVAGPVVFICDECVALCDDIVGPKGDVSCALLKAAIHGCRLLAELRWHDRLNETGRAVWWKLENALEQYALAKAGPAPIITPAFGSDGDGAPA